jgi:hypothetical protein
MTVQLERVLQQEIMLRLKALPVIAIPIPNSMFIPTRSPAEKELVKRVVYQMKNRGMLVPGACDIALMWAGGSAAIELKRPKTRDLLQTRPAGRPSDSQLAFERRCIELAIHHAYISSWPELSERLREWGVPMKIGRAAA